MNRRIQALVAATSLACVMAWAAPVRSVLAADLVTEQKQIRNETEKATADLNALILEFERNGLGQGADVEILKGIRNALANLSQKDMEKVIALLEKAKAGDARSTTQNLAAAVAGQKGISTQFNQLLVQYMHEQDLADVALRLTRLADRENQNMRAGTALYRSSKGASPKSYNDVQKAQVQVQQSEQQAIYAEAKVLLDRLATLAKQADPATAEHLNAVIAGADKAKLSTLLSGAADDLHNSSLFSAVGKERTGRDVLRDLARLVAPAKEPEDVLKEAVAQLNQAIRDENYIAQQAKQISKADKDSTDTIAQLDDRAGDSVDIAESVRKDIAAITPDAVPDLANATDKIQESRKNLTEADGKNAADKATAAAQKLTEARQKLLDQVARIEEQKAADTKIAKEKALLNQIIALRKSQELLQKDTGAAKDKSFDDLNVRETALATTGHDLQKTAIADAPAVAPTLDNAAKDMDTAHDDLGTKQNAVSAVKDQQLAVDELKKAEAMLAAEIATLEKKKEDLAKLEKAADQVAKMIKDQQKTEQETNKQAANDNKPKAGDPTPQDLAKDEDKIAKQANDTAKDISDTAPDAAKDLNNAAKDAQTAETDLNKPDAKAADPAAKAAADDLNKAKGDLDKQIADLKKDLGEPTDDAAKLADAANKIDKAQDDIANADQPDPMKQLQDTQKKIADDLKNLPQDQPAVQDAAKAAADAAKDLDNNNLDKAADDMQKAADAMQKADAAAKPDAAAKAALPDLEKRQDDAKKQLAAIKAGDTPPDAAAALADAGTQASDAQADDGGALPDDANKALADAKDALSDAAAAKAAGKPDNGATDKAKAALGKAKAAVAMKQAGLAAGEKGPGQGPPQPGQDGPPGQVDENNPTKGKGDRIDSTVNTDSHSATAGNANGASSFAGLPPRDRDAIQQSRSDKYPEAYGTMIEQYLKNLSDQSNNK